MDFVSAWYYKGSEYLEKYSNNISEVNKRTVICYVSTNSITQGEQVGILWSVLLNKFKIKIHFAHRTFKWSNEARGKAAVYCVIIGYSNFDISEKRLFEYEDIKGDPHERIVKNINQYLVDAKDILISNKSKPICNVPEMKYGSKPTDGGHFILTDDEKNKFLEIEPLAEKYIKPFLSAKEFLNNEKRWCIWLVGANPNELRSLPEILNRIEKVKKFRSESIAESTRNYPHHTLFRQVTQPDSDYILIPLHSSENRKYIPLGFFKKTEIVANSCSSVPNATVYHFGILTSEMHMSWVKHVCGRIKSDFRYSKDIVYNNFPWPENPSEKQVKTVEEAAQKVLDVREKFMHPAGNDIQATNPGNSPAHQFTSSPPNASLADLYDPLTMPPELVKAHQELDKAVDLCYRPQPFINETKRIEFLFELYDKYTAGMFANEERKSRKQKKQ